MKPIRHALALALLAASLLVPDRAAAVDRRTVISDIDYLKHHDLSALADDFITVTCYDAGAALCAGGGDFDKSGTSCMADDATIIQDSIGNCFYRKNFGLNGVVDARQCGVEGDDRDDDHDALDKCLALASEQKIPVVNTGGGQVIIAGHDVTIPADVELTCGGYGTATRDNDDYRLISGIPNVIVVDPDKTIAMPNPNSTFSGCNLLAGDKGGDYPYSPAHFYPGCSNTDYPECDDDPDHPLMRSALQEYAAFLGQASTSKGITVSAENTMVRNVTVLGFGTCYSSEMVVKSGKRHNIDHLLGDCDVGISVENDPGAAQFDNYIILPLLTRTNGNATTVNAVVQALTNVSGAYKATVEVPTAYNFAAGDAVWIGTSAVSGAESAAGRWTVGTDVNPLPTACPNTSSNPCQSFTLKGWDGGADSVANALTGTGDVSGVQRNGQPASAIVNLSVTRSELISVNQTVTDTGGCIPSGALVQDVWPAKGIVWLTKSATCTATGDSLTFTDHAFTYRTPVPDCSDGSASFADGCATTSSSFRFGDGVFMKDSGGVRSKGCTSFEHAVAFHMSTGANSSQFTDCQTGEDQQLPDKGIIGLLIDGDHGDDDSCSTQWQGGPLGQHRPIVILLDSDCPRTVKVTDADLSASDTNQRGVTAEVRSGSLSIVSSEAASVGNILFSGAGINEHDRPNRLFLSNNDMETTTLYLADGGATALTTGCGNVFANPTPYLCSPPVAVDPPKGRLTLTNGVPVMTADVTGATTIYYAPYSGQTVPVFDLLTNVFDQQDVGQSGLSLSLSTFAASGNVYDVFAETGRTGTVELCTGPSWSSGTGGSNAARGTGAGSTAITQQSGIWLNANHMTCSRSVASYDCPAYACTYLGSFYATATGQTEQQFAPGAALGGNGSCLCLYNAYNRVSVVSTSLDSNTTHTYGSTTWRPLSSTGSGGLLTGNSISVVDGLGQMLIDAKADVLTKGNTAASNAALIGVVVNSTTATPSYAAQNSANQLVSTVASLRKPPVMGLWYAQGMEAALVSGNVSFGGPTGLQVSVSVND